MAIASKKHGQSSRPRLGFRQNPAIHNHYVPNHEILFATPGNTPPEVIGAA
jgi:hypothetical protein